MILIIGIILFCFIALLVFVPLGRQINWQKNIRQSQNIALYQQQMTWNPTPELADELSQRLLDDEQALQTITRPSQSAVNSSPVFSGALWVVLIAVPLLYYFSLNRYAVVQQGEQAFVEKQQKMQTATAHAKNDDYIISIQNKLRTDPNDVARWLELGQAYVLSNKFEHALIAYGNAEKIAGSKPAILGLAATALYYQAGQRMTPKVRQLIDTALSQDENETSSLSLLASDAFLQTDYASAINYWQQLLDSERTEVNRRKTIESMGMAENLLRAKQVNE